MAIIAEEQFADRIIEDLEKHNGVQFKRGSKSIVMGWINRYGLEWMELLNRERRTVHEDAAQDAK